MTTRDSHTSDLLTADEREALEISGRLANLCRRIVGSGPQANNDWTEIATRIHAVQHMLMAQAAARAYPGEFRLLGQETKKGPRHTCTPGLIGSAYGCPACGLGPATIYSDPPLTDEDRQRQSSTVGPDSDR